MQTILLTPRKDVTFREVTFRLFPVITRRIKNKRSDPLKEERARCPTINERHIRQTVAPQCAPSHQQHRGQESSPLGDTCNELINLIYRRLTEIQSQMRATLIVRPLAADTIVYTYVSSLYSLTIALQLVSSIAPMFVESHVPVLSTVLFLGLFLPSFLLPFSPCTTHQPLSPFPFYIHISFCSSSFSFSFPLSVLFFSPLLLHTCISIYLLALFIAIFSILRITHIIWCNTYSLPLTEAIIRQYILPNVNIN